MIPSKFCQTVAAVVGLCLILATVTESASIPSRSYSNELEDIPPEVLWQMMAKLRETMLRAQDEFENPKRTVDFGLGRGYSGTLEAKHRMGLAAANYAGGPGRRRRSETNA